MQPRLNQDCSLYKTKACTIPGPNLTSLHLAPNPGLRSHRGRYTQRYRKLSVNATPNGTFSGQFHIFEPTSCQNGTNWNIANAVHNRLFYFSRRLSHKLYAETVSAIYNTSEQREVGRGELSQHNWKQASNVQTFMYYRTCTENLFVCLFRVFCAKPISWSPCRSA